MEKIAVVVTTEYKGVFFGYVDDPAIQDHRRLTLKNARMCVYWPPENHGVVGLASDGPADGSKISPAAQEIQLAGVTAIMQCSHKSVKNWEAGKWN